MYTLEKYYEPGFDSQQYWDTRYSQEHIAGKSSDEFRKQGFWPVLQKHLKTEGTYLDVGCGIGGWVLFLNDEGYQVHGVDNAARTIRAMTEYDRDLQLKIASMTSLPYKDEFFDGLLSIGSLEHAENAVDRALEEMHRVTKKGGFVFIEVPLANVARRLLYIPLKRIERLIKTFLGKQATFSHYLFGRQEMQDLLDRHGFDVVDVQPHELPQDQGHYGLYTDWKILRGSKPYHLNILGKIVQWKSELFSPWIASTGMVVVARKRS